MSGKKKHKLAARQQTSEAIATDRGDASKAMAEYRRAIALDPTYQQAYANLADLYRARGVDGEAETVLKQIEGAPGSGSGSQSRGRAP